MVKRKTSEPATVPAKITKSTNRDIEKLKATERDTKDDVIKRLIWFFHSHGDGDGVKLYNAYQRKKSG